MAPEAKPDDSKELGALADPQCTGECESAIYIQCRVKAIFSKKRPGIEAVPSSVERVLTPSDGAFAAQ